jgi:DNA-binding PucR family transcriptional regulator
VVVIGLLEASVDSQLEITQLAYLIEGLFAPGPLVLGPVVSTVSDASRSAKAALAANSVAATTNFSHRPILADELLPERALAGDALAKQTLLQNLYHPIADGSTELLNTLRTYLECGRSLEATSKVLFVHANTVRYRLRRIQEILGEDATDPRTAFVLQIALALGAIADSESGVKRD